MRKSAISYGEDVKKAMILLDAGTPIVCFDLETTGVSYLNDRILSFSAIKVVMNDGFPEEIGRVDFMIDPEIPIPPEASKVNHITDEMVKGCIKEEEAMKQIKRFLGDHPFVCGYNSVNFDERFVNAMYSRYNDSFTPIFHLDIMRMAKEKMDLKSYQLSSLSRELGVDAGLSFHNSIDDVIAAFRCFMILKKDYVDPDPKDKVRSVKVKSYSYWSGPNHRLERIYVQTVPYTKTYYDIYRKEWRSDEQINLDAVKAEVLQLADAADESQLVKRIRNNK